MTEVVEVETSTILAVEDEGATIVETEESIDVLSVAEQGPRGPQGPPGPSGGSVLVMVGPLPLSGHSAVAYRTDGLLQYADCSNPAHFGAVLGVLEDAYVPGDFAQVRQSYAITHEGWSWSPGPVFVGKGGYLVQTLPADAVFAQVIGFAQTAKMLNIDPQPPISLI
jgi:hypothetical protein